MPMIHIYAEKVVNFKPLSDHTSLTQLVVDHTMTHCCLRLSVEKSFPSRKMTTTTLCKWEETSPSPGRALNDRLVISEYVRNKQLQLKALPQVQLQLKYISPPGAARSCSVTRAPTRTTDQVSARSWMRLRIKQIHKVFHELSPQIHVGKSKMMAAAQIKGCRLKTTIATIFCANILREKSML